MATSQVRKIHEKTGRRVHVVGFNGKPQWSEVFENNPRIARERGDHVNVLKNAGGCRPYIQAKTAHRWYFKEWDKAPGEVFLDDEEKAFAEPFRGKVLIEPNTKVANGNKAWIPERWQQVVDAMACEFLQVGPASVGSLKGVTRVETTFRQAMAVLSVCKAYVGPEGALHHAAAALNVPAVVLWSEFIEPRFTGYETQINLRHAGPYCGSRKPCVGCKESMRAISVSEVVGNLERIL